MPSLQKKHNREIRESAEYIRHSRFWLVVIFLLLITIGIVASEVATRGNYTPFSDGGWLTYLIYRIVTWIREFIAMVSDAIKSLKV